MRDKGNKFALKYMTGFVNNLLSTIYYPISQQRIEYPLTNFRPQLANTAVIINI